MNRRTLLIPAVGALLLAMAGCQHGPQFQVSGHITDAADSMLYLEAMTLGGIQPLDSTRLKDDGAFCFKADAPSNPEFYALRIGSRRINFSIDSTEAITITAQLPTMVSDYRVEGSYNCEKIREIAIRQSQLQAQIIAIEKNAAILPGTAIDSINALVAAYKDLMRTQYIYREPLQTYAYYAVSQSIHDLNSTYQVFDPLTNRDDVKCYAAIATAWDGMYPDADRTVQLCNMAIRGMNNTAPPTQRIVELADSVVQEASIIDISLPDIVSNIHTISELKGKVVMLDFTAYSMPDSPERTRHMRELYNKYHDRGFEIYQISLDNDIHYWKTACENLPWICVHETNGTTTRLYGVSNLPTYFLINRANEVVLRSDMTTSTVEAELQKLL